MDFIIVPLVCWIIFNTVYKLFELFARRNERMRIIEKAENIKDFTYELPKSSSFSSLSVSLLLIGLGVGLFVGFIINRIGNQYFEIHYGENPLVIGSCVLIFGGLGLLIGNIAENNRKNNEKNIH